MDTTAVQVQFSLSFGNYLVFACACKCFWSGLFDIYKSDLIAPYAPCVNSTHFKIFPFAKPSRYITYNFKTSHTKNKKNPKTHPICPSLSLHCLSPSLLIPSSCSTPGLMLGACRTGLELSGIDGTLAHWHTGSATTAQ